MCILIFFLLSFLFDRVVYFLNLFERCGFKGNVYMYVYSFILVKCIVELIFEVCGGIFVCIF